MDRKVEVHEVDYYVTDPVQFVKDRVNILADSTRRYAYDYGKFKVVKEVITFQGNKEYWFWVFNQGFKTKYLILKSNIPKDLSLAVDLAYKYL